MIGGAFLSRSPDVIMNQATFFNKINLYNTINTILFNYISNLPMNFEYHFSSELVERPSKSTLSELGDETGSLQKFQQSFIAKLLLTRDL